MKRIIPFMLLMLAILSGCSPETPTIASDITLSSSSSQIEAGRDVKITVSTPDNRTLNEITWLFDESLAKLISKDSSSITLKAIKDGSLKVTATEKETGKSAAMEINIIPIPVLSDISLSSSSAELEIGREVKITVSTPDNRPLNEITWLFDESLAKLISKDRSSITLKTIKDGCLKVTATEKETGKSGSIEVNIIPRPVLSDISISSSSPEPEIGSEIKITVSTPDNRTLNEITWLFDEGLAELVTKDSSSITLKAIKEGRLNVTATEKETGKSAAIEVNIIPLPVFSDISLSSSSAELAIGREVKITVSTPDNRPLNEITWLFDESLAELISNDSSSITLKAKKDGHLNVTASEGKTGKSAEIKVNITTIDYKEYITSRLMKKNEFQQYIHISSNYQYPKKGTDFSSDVYRLMLEPGEKVSLHMVDGNGLEERNVRWFVESKIFSNPNGLYLFNAEETLNASGYAFEISPVIIREDGLGGVEIEGTDRFYSTAYEQDGCLIAVVDDMYVHRLPFYVLNAKEMEAKARHKEVQDVVAGMTEPLMKYEPLEIAYLMNRNVIEHLTYTYGADPSAYTYFVNGKAVCQGYSLMFKRLGNELGFDTRYLEGNSAGGYHAWNAIWIDDGFYYVDTTWNDSDYEVSGIYSDTLEYFFMDKSRFEGNGAYFHEPKLKDEVFGTRHLNRDNYFEPIIRKFTEEIPTSANSIPVPDLDKVTFHGLTRTSGYLRTEEDGIEYNVGNSEWIPLERGKDTLIEDISAVEDGIYHPGTSASIIGNPQFILLRRNTGDGWSNYVKKIVYKPTYDPDWIETSGNDILHANTDMEYRAEGSSRYMDVPSNEFSLPSGSYYFRMKGDENYLASNEVEVVIR